MDVTFGRTPFNKMRTITDKRDLLVQEVNTLMFMVPGYDEENPGRGINLSSFNGMLDTDEMLTKLDDAIRSNLEKFMNAKVTTISLEDVPNDPNAKTILLEFVKDNTNYLFKLDPSTSVNTLVIQKD